jgi:hypothetical protein
MIQTKWKVNFNTSPFPHYIAMIAHAKGIAEGKTCSSPGIKNLDLSIYSTHNMSSFQNTNSEAYRKAGKKRRAKAIRSSLSYDMDLELVGNLL